MICHRTVSPTCITNTNSFCPCTVLYQHKFYNSIFKVFACTGFVVYMQKSLILFQFILSSSHSAFCTMCFFPESTGWWYTSMFSKCRKGVSLSKATKPIYNNRVASETRIYQYSGRVSFYCAISVDWYTIFQQRLMYLLRSHCRQKYELAYCVQNFLDFDFETAKSKTSNLALIKSEWMSFSSELLQFCRSPMQLSVYAYTNYKRHLGWILFTRVINTKIIKHICLLLFLFRYPAKVCYGHCAHKSNIIYFFTCS